MNTLCADILRYLAGFLNNWDVISLATISKKAYAAVYNDESVWRPHIYEKLTSHPVRSQLPLTVLRRDLLNLSYYDTISRLRKGYEKACNFHSISPCQRYEHAARGGHLDLIGDEPDNHGIGHILDGSVFGGHLHIVRQYYPFATADTQRGVIVEAVKAPSQKVCKDVLDYVFSFSHDEGDIKHLINEKIRIFSTASHRDCLLDYLSEDLRKYYQEKCAQYVPRRNYSYEGQVVGRAMRMESHVTLNTFYGERTWGGDIWSQMHTMASGLQFTLPTYPRFGLMRNFIGIQNNPLQTPEGEKAGLVKPLPIAQSTSRAEAKPVQTAKPAKITDFLPTPRKTDRFHNTPNMKITKQQMRGHRR